LISALALLVGVFNIWRSERLARQNATQRLWSDAIEPVLRIPIDPADESLRDKLAPLRVRFTALADGLSKTKASIDGWPLSTVLAPRSGGTFRSPLFPT